MDWLIAFVITYGAGYTERVVTQQSFGSQYECMKTALSPDYRNSISGYYSDKGIRQVYIYCQIDYGNNVSYQEET